MSKLVLLDIDGVIVDMLEGIHRVLFEEGVTFFPENVETYNFHGDIGCPRTKVFETFSNVKTFEYIEKKCALDYLNTVIIEIYDYNY